MTDTSGKTTYYVNYDAEDETAGQAAKFDAEHPTDEITVTWKIVYNQGSDSTLTDAQIAIAYATMMESYEGNTNVEVVITPEADSRVKIGSTAQKAIQADSDDQEGITLSFTTTLPETATFNNGETSAYGGSEAKKFYYGIIGQDGNDDETDDFGDVVATLDLVAGA